ncbi:lipid-A-disaccharide synthase [Francisella frigiditurris]|uniref:Lipid-A-disaccharide synthase n=1 Tax=Francisella frigiditurris TaxID=1542390 RepID=A0A1J0KVS8_9GAMM|nr:lipid-A-disaccharide synthase [Francisella frigiditurris]APC97815.1 lipid-A-disaccharide synthase [Francisella frigiditurris]
MRIGIVAGELSGDQLGASLVKELKKTYPDAIIEGIGGPKMVANGFNTLYPMEALSVIGFFEVLSKGIQILNIRRKVINHFKENKPDIFIGIDAPDFNLTVEKKLRQARIRTVHYVSPKIWAWREYRIKKIKEATDTILAILPFEEEYYRTRHNFKAVFVGHPLAKAIPLEIDKQKYRKELGLSLEDTILAVLPGSRKSEVTKLLPVFLDALDKLKKDGYKYKAVIPIAKPSLRSIFEEYKEKINILPIIIYEGHSHEILKASDFCLLSSGTATLETMLCKLPMVVGYKLSKVSAFLARLLVKGKHSYFAFPNILSGKEIISELIQEDFTVEKVLFQLKRLFDDDARNKRIVSEFHEIHKKMIVDTDIKIVEEVQKLLSSTC